MLQVIGAGYPRTGTYSLRSALIHILGGDCYHMRTVNENPDHVRLWLDAVNGKEPVWNLLLAGHTAAVDWPISTFWNDLAAAFPNALVLLSERRDTDTWWRSFNENILSMHRVEPSPEMRSRIAMVRQLLERELGSDWDDEAAARSAYEKHLDAVVDAIPAERLIRWRPEQGWSPLCIALGKPIPTMPFPYLNTTEQRRRMSQEHGVR